MPYGEFKIKTVYEKEHKNFTALNIKVDMQGEDVWLNGYLDKHNRKWQEGDTVAVNYWFDDAKEWYKYKPAEEGDRDNGEDGSTSQGQQQNKSKQPPREQQQPPGDGVTNAEIKKLIIRTAEFIAKLDKKVDGLTKRLAILEAAMDKTSHLDTGNGGNDKSANPEQDDRDYFKNMDDDLPF